MGELATVVGLLATDAGFAAEFRARPAEAAARFGLSPDEVTQLLALTVAPAEAAMEQLPGRVSKSSIGAAGIGSFFHGLGAQPDTASVQPVELTNLTPDMHEHRVDTVVTTMLQGAQEMYEKGQFTK